MFYAAEHSRVSLPHRDLYGSTWPYVELLMNAEWLFADCYITEDEIKIRMSYLVSNPAQLHELINKPDISIVGVYVASPPYMNNTDSWKMDKVLRITRAAFVGDESHQNEFNRYELTNGGEYYSSGNIKSDRRVENIQVLFSM